MVLNDLPSSSPVPLPLEPHVLAFCHLHYIYVYNYICNSEREFNLKQVTGEKGGYGFSYNPQIKGAIIGNLLQ